MGSPKPPAPPPVPIPPPLAPQLSSKDVSAAATAYQNTAASARGMAGTILTSGQGDSMGTYAGKQLTGQ